MDALLRQLWAGPLTDPAAPGQVLPDSYHAALRHARLLVRLDLPFDRAAVCARWPWSIDLGWLTFEADGDPSALAAAVRHQNRRFGTLARAYWSQGQTEQALQVLEPLDPHSETYAEDRLVRAELRILADLEAEPLPGPRGVHLSLLACWRREGAAAVARRLALEEAALPAHAPLWSWLVETFVLERDFARAGAALDSFARRCPDHPDVTFQRIRLALEAEDQARARALIDAQGDGAEPWRWPARRHVQHLRCLSDEIAGQSTPDYTPLRVQAAAALRLFPRHGGLQGLWLSARQLTEDWDRLIEALAHFPDQRLAGSFLLRLGLPDEALALLDSAGSAPPDERFRTRLRQAEAQLRRGDLAAARDRLGPLPAAAPLAADHAYWTAEIAAAARDLPEATRALAPALETSPTRMGLRLTAARVAFLGGEDAEALAQLTRFRQLKEAQTGLPPADDLRDLIVRDAAGGQPGPGLAARTFAQLTPLFRPLEGPPIPATIAHYWEGPRSPSLERSLRRWGQHYPQTLHDFASARDWLARHTDLAPLFDRLDQPATRADLFRVALLAEGGGLYADLDEYPRAPLDDWLQGASAVLVIEEGHGTLANNFLAARPGLPLFTHLRDRIAAGLNRREKPYPWWDSGPAPLTEAALLLCKAPGYRFLTQPEYEARVATNLPFPHKRGPGHWR